MVQGISHYVYTYIIYTVIFRPIHDAIEAGNMEIVKLLVEHGADVMAEYSEKTPFELATYLEQNEIAYYLKGIGDQV